MNSCETFESQPGPHQNFILIVLCLNTEHPARTQNRYKKRHQLQVDSGHHILSLEYLRSMEDAALWQACDAQALRHVGMCNGADNHANIGACVPQPQFLPWGADWPSRGDDVGLSSLVDSVTFDQVSSLPDGHQLLNFPSGTESQDLVVGNPKFAHHGQWGHASMPPERFTAPSDMQELLYVQALGSSPLVQQDYSNIPGPSVFNKPFSVPQSAGGGSIGRATAQAQYVPPLVSNPLGMFTADLPGGTITNAGLDGVGNSNISLMHLPKRHVPHMPSNRAPSVPANPSVDPLSSIGGGGSPTLGAFTPPPKKNVLVPSLSGSSIPRKLGVAGEQPNMSSFNPGPYVGNVVTAEQQRQEALAARRMWGGDKSSNNHLSPNVSFEQRPQSVTGDSRFLKGDMGESMVKWSPVQIGAMGRAVGEEKASVNVQQPETARMKCVMPTSVPSAVSLSAADSSNTARKRPIWVCKHVLLHGFYLVYYILVSFIRSC